MVANQLFVLFVALLAAALFAPPIALKRVARCGNWLMRTRFGRFFASKRERDAIEQVTILDLTAAALNSGMAIPAALRAVELSLGPAAESRLRSSEKQNGIDAVGILPFRQNGARRNKTNASKKKSQKLDPADRGLDQVAASLLMGATWDEAWEGAAKQNLVLYDVLAPAWEDGAAPVPLLERTVATLRLTHQSRANAAAGRLGARLVAPLALCFLPAFMLIGVVPILVLAAKQIF